MIVVRKVLGLATVQDLGRVGFASQGLPRGGALVGSFLRAANAAAGNDDAAACIEIFGRFACAADADVVVADERGRARLLRAGEELVLDPDPSLRVRYLAVAGGVDAPVVLSSRSTFASCGIGRALRRGDRIESAHAPTRTREPVILEHGPIHALAGPDVCDAIFETTFRVSTTSDRTGTRLDCASPLTSPTTTMMMSSPTVIGAIQLPQGGAPIVIGPDGPTTGGYPIVAVIARADCDRFHALPLGASVTFVRAAPR
jgi:allophanate hydrolase subunit 2